MGYGEGWRWGYLGLASGLGLGSGLGLRLTEYSAGAALDFLPFMLLRMQKWLPCGLSCGHLR